MESMEKFHERVEMEKLNERVQENESLIEKIKESKVDGEDIDKAFMKETEMITEGTYATTIKREVDQHQWYGFADIIKIGEVRKRTIIEQDRENRTGNIILYNVQESQAVGPRT